MHRIVFFLFVAAVDFSSALHAQTPASPAAAVSTVKPATRGQADLNADLAAAKMKTTMEAIRNFVRPYEPTELGLTKDKSDELFMDFKISLMFPLLGHYPDQLTKDGKPWWRLGPFDSRHSAVLFSATIRGGQYIWSRPSAPVVEKRFNPQAIARLWFIKNPDLQRYVDVIYGHESNGQSVNLLERFNEQQDIYRKLEKHPNSDEARVHAARSARDSISRGWDYVGAEISWFWPSGKKANETADVSGAGKIKLRHFLDHGFLQRGKEEYNEWEGDGRRHPRSHYDGVMLQYTGVLKLVAEGVPGFTGRYTVTYTTGLTHPFQHSTWDFDVGATWRGLPLSIWYRRGYNSDLIDYYKESQSYGGKISIWQF
jgi:hypothetical protein